MLVLGAELDTWYCSGCSVAAVDVGTASDVVEQYICGIAVDIGCRCGTAAEVLLQAGSSMVSSSIPSAGCYYSLWKGSSCMVFWEAVNAHQLCMLRQVQVQLCQERYLLLLCDRLL